jgi:hypothetical protein
MYTPPVGVSIDVGHAWLVWNAVPHDPIFVPEQGRALQICFRLCTFPHRPRVDESNGFDDALISVCLYGKNFRKAYENHNFRSTDIYGVRDSWQVKTAVNKVRLQLCRLPS